MAGNSTAQSWANRTKQDLSSTPVSQLKRVGGSLEPINVYFQMTEPRKGAPETARKLNPNDEILGTYEGSFTTKRFGTTYHKVRTEANGLVAIPGSGQLNSLMKKVAQGAEVQIIYQGKETIKKGNFAGKPAHNFIVNASEMA